MIKLKKDLNNKDWYHVNIPLTKSLSMETIFSIEDELRKKGISFDTGSDFSSRDWELDWSLHGATPKQVMKILEDKGIKFNATMNFYKKVNKMKNLKCSACGKEVESNGKSFIGITIKITYEDNKEFPIEFIQKQMGKYKVNKQYNICWECWLKSMGVKP